MAASRTFPLEVACNGVSSPTQLWVPTAEGPLLFHIDREMGSQNSDIDRVADLGGKPAADLAALLSDVEPSQHGIGQTQDSDTEPILAALLSLLHQLVFLECTEEAKRRGPVHADAGGKFGAACVTAVGKQLQHRHRTINRLGTPLPACRLAVVHRATIAE